MPTHNIVHTLHNCATTCDSMTSKLLMYPDVHQRYNQIQLLTDCTNICDITARSIVRKSGFSRSMADFCAYVCDACAAECLRFSDQDSQHCARICLDCAKECRMYAM